MIDPERGETISSDSGYRTKSMNDFSTEGLSRAGTQREHRDFDDGANSLWSLYGKEAKTHDEDRFMSLASNMEGVLLFAGLFSGVLTSFLVQSTPSLRVNPAKQSVYYQNQSVYYQQQSAYYQQQSAAMLAQISQQLASIALQVSVPSISAPPTILPSSVPSAAQQVAILSTPPPPYPTFEPSFSDIRVNAYWVVGLVCSLSAALLAILIRQWVRSYMQIFQRYDHPLKRARFRQFFFEGSNGVRQLAIQVPRLIYVSLFLFFLGLCDSMLNTNTTVGVTTIVPICLCGIFYLYSVTTHLKDLQSPYKTLISLPIFFLIQQYQRLFGDRKWRTSTTIEAYREGLVMEETEERKERDVRAIRWLVDNSTVNAKMEPLVLAIPGSFNTEWGRGVWRDVTSQARSEPDTPKSQTDHSPAGGQVYLTHHSPRFLEGTAGDTICRSVRYLVETCKNRSYFENEEARRRRMRACVEAAASLVCCIGFQSDRFGEVGKLVSEIGRIEKINQSLTTTSDQSFIIRWTCLSLVSVQQILSSSRLQVLAGYAMSGLTRLQSECGQPDETARRSAQMIEEFLKTAWKHAEELHQAFEPWTQKKTREQVEETLRKYERQISELERIKVEADGMEDVDWRISLCQDAMDEATYGLARQLPGVPFDVPRRAESFLISDTFNTPLTGSAPVAPQLIFPGQQVQALARLGSKLREVLDGHVADEYKDVLESLKSVDQFPVSLRRPNGLMKRQLWRLQDLRDGGGLGYTVELFFLSLRQLLSMRSIHESDSVFYIGAFKIITSRWEKSRESQGTQLLLLNLICDLIIQDRGDFSNFLYPEPITDRLLNLVGNIQGYAGPHIRDVVREIQNVDSKTCMDIELQRRALARFGGSQSISPTVL